ncbi:lytic transglycosylase domain-containing protein [uncultured Tateyamaria sp.]|uniref:lytic transglycosylase domain-containing protein n=1 Tax=uncultured Tateyamaria sp. TaxID=455651 RepID=UPI0026385A5B|nr:lytic transglycosylase domain-containing protein [uncultured Tateyamaria sp.]
MAQTFTVDKDGNLVEQEPLIAANQTTVFFDGSGRPVRPIAVEAEEAEEEQASSTTLRRPATYDKRHIQVIQNVQMVARRYQRDPALRRVEYSPKQWAALFQAMIKIESNFNPTARSHANAIGLAQIISDTAKYLRIDVNDPIQNLDGGARYLLEQIETFGDVRLALAAYNAGPQAVRQHSGIPPYRETQNHVRLVMAEYQKLTN